MRALVTGGGGYLGGRIVEGLLERGASVRVLARGEYPELAAQGVECVRGDLADAKGVNEAVQDMTIVFHAAAKTGSWGSYASYHAANVNGTENIIAACRAHGVERLVYTSTPSVTFDGTDQEGIDESAPLPERFLGHYSHTKAIAEQLVLRANSAALATIALRPHLIWGPGDTQLVPRILARARAGRLRFVGDGENLIDATYIDNAAAAHLLASDRLAPGSACAGNAYFISNGEPWPMKRVINGILGAAALPPLEKTIPEGVAYAAGALTEIVYTLLRRQDEPTMTRFVARQLATAHWYDISAAKRDFGYEVQVSMEEGMRRLAESLR